MHLSHKLGGIRRKKTICRTARQSEAETFRTERGERGHKKVSVDPELGWTGREEKRGKSGCVFETFLLG